MLNSVSVVNNDLSNALITPADRDRRIHYTTYLKRVRLDDAKVRGDPHAGLHQHQVTQHQILSRHVHVLASAADAGLLRHHVLWGDVAWLAVSGLGVEV